jgi:hypothetical protein
MRLSILVVAAAFCAGAAYGQESQCGGSGSKARMEFVDAYRAASQALQARDWNGALRAAAEARPFAMDGSQVAVLIQIQIAAIAETEDKATFMAALQAALDTPCLSEQVSDNYARRLQELRSDAASQQQ